LLKITKYESEGQIPTVRVKVKPKNALQKIKEVISKTFNVPNYALMLRYVHKGCIELTFVGPNPSVI